MNKKHTKEDSPAPIERILPRLIEVKNPTEERLEEVEKDLTKLKKEFKHMQKSFQEKEFDIYSRIIDRETDIFRLEYKVHDLKMAIIALCITLIGYFVINIIKIVWSK